MNPWSRVNLALLLLAAALLVLDRWPPAAAPTSRLTAIDPATVQSLRIESGNRLVLAFARSGDAWRLTHPEAAQAAPRRVEQLLAITRAPVLQRLDDADEPTAFGLTPPRAVLQVDATRLAFGDLDPTQRGRYVQTDAGLMTVDDVYFQLLTLPLQHFKGD